MRPYTHTKRDGLTVDRHRLIWTEANGPIPEGYVVHHINHNKRDNRLENLMLMTRQEHSAHHNQIHPLVKACEVCGSEYEPHPTKRKRSKTCSYVCARELMRVAAVAREARKRDVA